MSNFSLENRICDSFLRVTEERLNAYGIQQYSILPSSKKEKNGTNNTFNITGSNIDILHVYISIVILFKFLVSVEDWIEPPKRNRKWMKMTESVLVIEAKRCN